MKFSEYIKNLFSFNHSYCFVSKYSKQKQSEKQNNVVPTYSLIQNSKKNRDVKYKHIRILNKTRLNVNSLNKNNPFDSINKKIREIRIKNNE